jgi:uncharacterized protein (DUF2252 family)
MTVARTVRRRRVVRVEQGPRGSGARARPEFEGRGPIEARRRAGRAARDRTPRSALGEFKCGRRDPIALLERSNAGRIAELVPIRHGRMVASPFAFFRGAAVLMAHDLSQLPNSGVGVQLCGDAHLANFGLFGSPERRVLFGINDFDETLPGPFDWDVRRLAASLVIAARDRGHGARHQRRAVRQMCASFREGLGRCLELDTLETWYRQMTAQDMLALASTSGDRKRENEVVEHARVRDSRSLAGHATETVGGKLRIRDVQPLTYHYPAKSKREAARFDSVVRRFFADYRRTLPEDRRVLFDRFRLVDSAVRVVGVGSVGTRCYVSLFVADGETPLFLQVKEARSSVLETYLPRSAYENRGRRVVVGQRLLQPTSDIFLGWARSSASGIDFYVRQLRDMKGAFDVATFTPPELDDYARACGQALAIAMSKAGDPAPIAGYVGKSDAFDHAMVRFAFAYADQNEADWKTFLAAVRSGRLPATEDA